MHNDGKNLGRFESNIDPTIDGLRAIAWSEIRGGNYNNAETIFLDALNILVEEEKKNKYELDKSSLALLPHVTDVV